MKKEEKQAAEDLELYKAHVMYWDNRLGLKNWYKTYESAIQPEVAAIEPKYQERLVNFSISEDRPSTFPIAELALHEALELLMNDLEETAEEFYSEKYIRRLIHDVIHALESVIALPTDAEVKAKKGVK